MSDCYRCDSTARGTYLCERHQEERRLFLEQYHTARAMGISPRTALRIASDLLDANHAALGPEQQTTEDA